MKNLIAIIIFLCLIGCSRKNNYNTQESVQSIEIIAIDSAENSYFVKCKSKENNKEFVLISPKVEINDCLKIGIGNKYKLRIDFQSFMAGDYGNYIVDGEEFSIDTVLAFSKDLQGLCLVNNKEFKK